MNVLVLVVFAAASLPAFFIGRHMRGRPAGGATSAQDPALAAFIGRAMYGIGALIVATGVALAIASSPYQKPIGIAFVVACNLLVGLVLFRASQSRRQRRER